MTGSTGSGDGCGSNDWTLASEGGKRGGGGGGGRHDACMALHIRAQHTWKTLPSSQTEEERRMEYGSHPCSSLCICQEEEEEEEEEVEEEEEKEEEEEEVETYLQNIM